MSEVQDAIDREKASAIHRAAKEHWPEAIKGGPNSGLVHLRGFKAGYELACRDLLGSGTCTKCKTNPRKVVVLCDDCFERRAK